MKAKLSSVYFFISVFFLPVTVSAMHISEGFLPKEHAVGWLLAVLPILVFGTWQINVLLANYPERKMLLGLVAAFIFVLSALKIPSVTGSTSHPTGIGLSAVLFGPNVSVVLSGIVLIFQALLLAHGGITTWGANLFSMGVVGSVVAWGLFYSSYKMGLSEKTALFVATACGDWATYMTTAGQLALAFPDAINGVWGAYSKFLGIFAITQIPLAISEGFLSVIVYNTLLSYERAGMLKLWWRSKEDNI